MFRRLVIWGIFSLVFIGSIGFGMTETVTVQQKIKDALLKNNYYAEYSETKFRFGRRSDTLFKVWVKDDQRFKQTVGPAWQWGELAVYTPTGYSYYLPSQKSGFKQVQPLSRNKIRLGDWEPWIKYVEKVEYDSILLGRAVLVLSGNTGSETFKLTVDQATYLPVSLEVYKQNLLAKSIVFQKMEMLSPGFQLLKLLPEEGIKWYGDEAAFWQAVSLPRVQSGVNFNILLPAYLPHGYGFKKAVLEELSSATVVHLIYEGPGKQLISIFQREKLSDNQKLALESLKTNFKMKNVTINALQGFEKNIHFAIIAPLSKDDLKKVAQSLK